MEKLKVIIVLVLLSMILVACGHNEDGSKKTFMDPQIKSYNKAKDVQKVINNDALNTKQAIDKQLNNKK